MSQTNMPGYNSAKMSWPGAQGISNSQQHANKVGQQPLVAAIGTNTRNRVIKNARSPLKSGDRDSEIDITMDSGTDQEPVAPPGYLESNLHVPSTSIGHAAVSSGPTVGHNPEFLRNFSLASQTLGGPAWQHNVPHRMPWMSQASGSVMQFTATTSMASSVSYTSTTSHASPHISDSESENALAWSRSRRRLKRRGALTELDCPRAKVHVNEEKMAASLQELNIGSPNRGTQAFPPLDNNNYLSADAALPGTSRGPDQRPSWPGGARPKAWPRRKNTQFTLQEIESRLSDEDESDEDSNDGGGSSSSSSDPDKPKLVLSSQLKQKIRNTPDVLPRKILEKISKPASGSMEVVLWRPPGGIPELVKDIILSAARPDVLPSLKMHDSNAVASAENLVNSMHCGETEMEDCASNGEASPFSCDNDDDDMDL